MLPYHFSLPGIDIDVGLLGVGLGPVMGVPHGTPKGLLLVGHGLALYHVGRRPRDMWALKTWGAHHHPVRAQGCIL